MLPILVGRHFFEFVPMTDDKTQVIQGEEFRGLYYPLFAGRKKMLALTPAYERFNQELATRSSLGRFVASVDPFRVVACRHVPTVAGSVLEAQSDHLQASVFSVGTLVPLPTLWHFNEARIGFLQRSCKAEFKS